VGLVPHQSFRSLGSEYLVMDAVAVALLAVILRAAHKVAKGRPAREFASRPLALIAVVPTLIAGALMVSGHIDGLDWLVVATILCLLTCITDAWVLLVEILR
jgi:hypothetical protein